MDDENTIEAVEKVLKEPVAAEFSEQTWKIRTNLTVVSSIAVVMCLAQLRITSDSSILGLKFSGLNDSVIRTTLSVLVAYLLFHFVWAAWDGLLEWRLRVTGTRTAFHTGAFWTSHHADFPIEPRQSTLYNWWVHQRGNISELGSKALDLEQRCSGWIQKLALLEKEEGLIHAPTWQNIEQVKLLIEQAMDRVQGLSRNVAANTKLVADARIEASLQRFDAWYGMFLRSQNLRWICVELAAPVAFAVFALYLLQR